MISVGGITAGGSGKTPFTIALCRQLLELEPRLARPHALCILSRGYGRKSTGLVEVQVASPFAECGDEPLLIKQALPSSGVIIYADRRVSAQYAIEQLGAKLLVLDDGFQHGLLARDTNLVVVDGQRPLGNGHVLPAGPLREFSSALRVATHLIAVGDASAETRELGARFQLPLTTTVSRMTLSDDVRGQACGAFCGIARPERFFAGLEQAGAQLVYKRTFRDHHNFSSHELEATVSAAIRAGATRLVTTVKDRVRFQAMPPGLPLVTSDIELGLLAGSELRDELKLLLSRLVW